MLAVRLLLRTAASAARAPQTLAPLAPGTESRTALNAMPAAHPAPHQRHVQASATNQRISHLSDPENKGQRQAGTNFDALGSWNNRLELQVNIEQSIKRGSIVPEIHLESSGSASLIGRRQSNEDRIIACEVRPNLLLFGVFDGHGGALASDYAEKHLIDHICFWLDRGEKDLETVLFNAFVDLNNKFTRYLYNHCIGDDTSLQAGTTATVALLKNDTHLYIANVGDSRAILCRDGKGIRLTTDHLPDVVTESDRIKEAGGKITWSSIGKPRINGILQMTRSIGDVELKPYGVIAEPETRYLTVKHSHDAFLLLTTDGVHNVLNSQEMADIICSCKHPAEGAKFVTDQALLFGSEDNCSALVLPFGAWGKFASGKFLSGFTRNIVGSRDG